MVIHFIVLSHGNNGQFQDMQHLESLLQSKFKCSGSVSSIDSANQQTSDSSPTINTTLYTLCTKSNSNDTHLGIEEGGRRMAREIMEYFRAEILPSITDTTNNGLDQDEKNFEKIKFSLIGHSLGGLYCRFAACELMEQDEFLKWFEPIGLTTICSPHLGSKRPGNNGWFNFYGNVVSGIANTYMNYFLGETGRQFALSDRLLFEMSEPESKYVRAWNCFKFKTLIGCTHNDLSVPHVGACLSIENKFPFPKKSSPIEFSIVGHSGFDENYSFPKDLELNFEKDNLDESDGKDELIPDSNHEQLISPSMLNNLQHHINFRRIHVQFSYPSWYHSTNGYVHDMVINKVKKHYWINQNEKAALECVEMIVDMVLMDHSLL